MVEQHFSLGSISKFKINNTRKGNCPLFGTCDTKLNALYLEVLLFKT